MQNLLVVTFAVILPLLPAYLLYRLLPSEGSVEGPWHGFRIKLGGAFAGYFILVVTILAFWKTLPQYEFWTVEGEIRLADDEPFHRTLVSFAIDPREVPLPDGHFSLLVTAKPNHAGDRVLPSLIIEHPGYRPEPVHLERIGNRNVSGRSLRLPNPVILKPNPPTVPVEN